MSLLPCSFSGRNALEVAVQAATEAGDILVTHFHHHKQLKYKGRGNVVTDVDLLAEKRIIALLHSEYPDFGIVSEESPHIVANSDYTWVVDPLDGTNNYTFGIPFFAITIALTGGEDILLGLIYDPLRKELFRATKGRGAFLNDLAISVSPRTSLSASLIGCDMGYDEEGGRFTLQTLSALWPGLHSLRIIGSAALGLAYVACGRFDLYFHRWLYPWDLASGILLVREAGGKISDWEGKPAQVQSKQIIAGNKTVHQEFLQGVIQRAAAKEIR